MEEVNIEHGKGSIYGRLYVPEEAASDSIVILSHGFGGSYRNTEDYAEKFAQNGITAFAYDFTGGGSGSRSGGSTTEMSVLTEADPEKCEELHPAPVHIGRNVRLGANVTVLPGVTIGDGVIIAAGAVVTKDIPAHAIAVGNPARVVRVVE